MKAEDLKGKTPDELKDSLMELKKQQFNLRFQLRQGQLSNTSQLRGVRRDVARILTAMSPAAQAAPVAKKAKAKLAAGGGDAPAKKTKKPAAKKSAA